jgi:hypothetical protein
MIMFIHIIVYTILAVCLTVVAGKVVWNIGLPYAMLREHLRGTRRSWSIFPAIEVIPLLAAIGLSFIISSDGVLIPSRLAIWGFAAIAVSYCHFAVVSLVYGIFLWWQRRRANRGKTTK